jgi:hypothetical protein
MANTPDTSDGAENKKAEAPVLMAPASPKAAEKAPLCYRDIKRPAKTISGGMITLKRQPIFSQEECTATPEGQPVYRDGAAAAPTPPPATPSAPPPSPPTATSRPPALAPLPDPNSSEGLLIKTYLKILGARGIEKLNLKSDAAAAFIFEKGQKIYVKVGHEKGNDPHDTITVYIPGESKPKTEGRKPESAFIVAHFTSSRTSERMEMQSFYYPAGAGLNVDTLLAQKPETMTPIVENKETREGKVTLPNGTTHSVSVRVMDTISSYGQDLADTALALNIGIDGNNRDLTDAMKQARARERDIAQRFVSEACQQQKQDPQKYGKPSPACP